MGFKKDEYYNAVNEFTKAMEHIPAVIHIDNDKAYSRICQLLRIARLDVVHTDTDGTQNSDTIYGYKNPKTPFPIVISKMAGNGANVIYSAYQYENDAFWDNEDKAAVEDFLRLVYLLNGRVMAINIAERLTFYDPAMEIENLTSFFRKITMQINLGNIDKYGACYFNIKRFSVVNRMFGREQGTEIMKSFVKTLAAGLSPDEGVFRVGGDNFTVLFHKDKLGIVRSHLKSTSIKVKTNNYGKQSITLNTYAGFLMCDKDIKRFTDVMDKLSTALSIARSTPKDSCFFFNEEAKRRVDHRKLIEASFLTALQSEQFLVYYQPKVDLSNGEIIGAEALCRWYKDGSVVPPAAFIPILEMSSAICELDFYMLDHVCRDIRQWLDDGRDIVKVSVNLSRIHLGDEALLNKVIKIIDKNNVPHEYIEIELTETTTDVDFGELRTIVSGLHKNGISASVDDFGIGYSSLTLIKELPWDVLKIDKSFLPDGSPNDKQKTVMLRHVIQMAQGLGLECIVEGVETAEQVKLLRDFRCYHAQGFYFDKPLPKSEYEKRLTHKYEFKQSPA